MVKKPRMVRTFARTATKSQEKHLIENAKKLHKNPFIILPKCTNKECEKYFSKIKKKLEKIDRYKDDTNKLEKLSKKKTLDAAVAGTLLLAESEKAPYLGSVKFPTGDVVVFAQRGGADKEKLIATQNFDDPILRLLAIKDVALKKRLYVYSWDKDYICTGLEPKPPEEFVKFVLRKTGLKIQNNIYYCEHLNPEKIKNKEFQKKYYLRINWKSAKKIIATCEDCAKTSKNTLFSISKYLLQSDLSRDFEIEVIAQVIKQKESATKQETLFLDEYLTGKIKDHELIQKNVKKQKHNIQQSEEKIFILDGVSYGSNIDKFLDVLKPDKYERKGLEYILEKIEEPLILTKTSPNKILEMYWKDYGKEFINSIIEDADMADSFFHLDDIPSNIIKMVFEYKDRQKILSQLPRYDKLPPLAKYADHIARTFRTFGEKKTITEIGNRPDNPKGKSLAYAFYLVFGKGNDVKWKFSSVEVEYGEFLKDYAKKLLDVTPKQYNKALKDLLTASGSGETIETN